MFRLRIGLRYKLGFWMLLLGIAPLVFAGVLTLSMLFARLFLLSTQLEEAEAFLRVNVVGRNLTGAAADTVVDMDTYLLERIDDVRRWSEEDVIVKAALEGSQSAQKLGLGGIAGNDAAVKEKLAGDLFVPITYTVFSPALSYVFRQVENQPVYLEILLTDLHGLNLLATRRVDRVAHTNEAWWQDANRMDRAGMGIVEPFVDVATGKPAMAIALPVVDPNTKRMLGSLRAIISLEGLQQRISQKAVSDSAEIQVLTSEGRPVADTASNHSLAVVISSTLDLEGTPAGMALSAQLGPGGAGFTVVDAPSGNVLAGYAHTSGSEFYDHRARLSGFPGFGWGVVVSQPEAVALQVLNKLILTGEELAQLPDQLGWLFAITGVLAASFSLLGAIILSGQISTPLIALSRQAQRVRQGDLDVQVTPHSGDEVGILESAFNEMADGLRQRERERDIFGRVVSPDVREKLLTGKLELGGETRWVAVLFSDIRDFSSLSEKMSPQEVVAFLNEYMTEMTEAIRPWGGYINNFIGDAIVAIFGAPLDQSDKEWKAVAAALTMRRRLSALNERRIQRGDVPIRSGIGISTGEVVAGQIGSLDRLLYTVIGDAVNVAARLEALTKDMDYAILINGVTAEAVQRQRSIILKPLGPTQVKGRSEPVTLFAVFEKGDPEAQDPLISFPEGGFL
ncbi:MAG: adenylate/guanylate cyclase domain-containing protein [Chloroflexota bacterium]